LHEALSYLKPPLAFNPFSLSPPAVRGLACPYVDSGGIGGYTSPTTPYLSIIGHRQIIGGDGNASLERIQQLDGDERTVYNVYMDERKKEAMENLVWFSWCVLRQLWMNAHGWPGWCDPAPYMEKERSTEERVIIFARFLRLVIDKTVDGLKHPLHSHYWRLLLVEMGLWFE